MVYIVAASSLYHSLEQLSNPKKEQLLPKISGIRWLSLTKHHETTEETRKPTLLGISSRKTSSGGVARSSATAQTITKLSLQRNW